jgi:hypothetical protein
MIPVAHNNDSPARKIIFRIDPICFNAGKIVKRLIQTKDGKERNTKCVRL